MVHETSFAYVAVVIVTCSMMQSVTAEEGDGRSGGIGGAFGGGIWTMKLSALTDPDVKEAQCCKQQRARDRVDSKRQQVWKGVVETR